MTTGRVECYDFDLTEIAVSVRNSTAVYDLTGLTLSWIVADRITWESLLQIDVTDHISPTNGESVFTLTPAQKVTIGGAGKYILICILVDGSGNETTRGIADLSVLRRTAREVGE